MSIAYIKLGHIQQSISIVEEATKKSNEWILDQGPIYYYTAAMKSLDRMDLIEAVWEKAVAADKKSTAHLEKLFSACLRSGNNTRLISSAIELWKMTNDDKYLMWSIVARAQPELKADLPRAASIVAASCAPISSSSSESASSSSVVAAPVPNKILGLSHMLFVSKFIEPGIVTKHTDLDFMLRVLLQQCEYEKALELLRSDLAKRLYGIGFQRLSEEAAVLLRIDRLEEAKQAYSMLLSTHNADEWSWYLGYFDAMFGVRRPIAHVDADKVTEARLFVQSLQTKAEDGVKLRGPYLAELELDTLTNDGKSNLQLLISFFQQFSSKPSCYRDMLPYIKFISAEAQLQLLDSIKSTVVLDIAALEPTTPLNVFGTISTYKSLLRTIKSPKMTESSRNEEIASLWSLYNAARRLVHPREPAERFCGDDLLLLVAHYHCDAFLAESSNSSGESLHHFEVRLSALQCPLRHLVLAATALEHGVAHSKFNFQFRLLLNEVYVAMGSVRAMIEQFDGVDVKHIQLDSVGYLFVDPLVRYSSMTDLNKIVKRSMAFYDESRKTTSDFAFEAFQKGAYHKVKEVMNFSDRLNNSSHRLALRLEHFYLTLAESSSMPNSLSLLAGFDPLRQLPSSLEDTSKFYKNHDGEAMDWFALAPPRFKHIEVPSAGIRSACYPDQLQDARILLSSLYAQILAILAEYQPPAPGEKPAPAPSTPVSTRIAPLASKLAATIDTSFNQPNSTERFIWNFVSNTLNILLATSEISPLLAADKHDEAKVAVVKNAVTAMAQDCEKLNAMLTNAAAGNVISSTNVALLTLFLTRSLVAIPLSLPLLPKLMPGKPKPKTPEEVKSQTAALKNAFREAADVVRKQLANLEQILQAELANSSNFENDPAALKGLLPEAVSQKTLERVIDGLVYSRKDTLNTLIGLVQNKIRDFKSL